MKYGALALSVLLAFAFVACSDDDSNGGSGNGTAGWGTIDSSKIYISEYFTGMNNDKYLEIYNANSVPVAAARVTVRKFNYSGTPSAYKAAVDLVLNDPAGYTNGVTAPALIAANSCVVLVSKDATATKRGIPHAYAVGYQVASYGTALATQIFNFNGDDGLALLVDNKLVDLMGVEDASGFGFINANFNQVGATCYVGAGPFAYRPLQYSKLVRKSGKTASATAWTTIVPDTTVWTAQRLATGNANGFVTYTTNPAAPTVGVMAYVDADPSLSAGTHTP